MPISRNTPSSLRSGLSRFAQDALLHGRAAAEATLEVLWPTRCAVCDSPGTLLCAECQARLPYLDWWRACKRCGAAYGMMQCCECNPVSLSGLGRSEPAYDGCASCVAFDETSARLVRAWKDQGEQRLALVLAELCAPLAPPEWLDCQPVVSSIPPTRAALARRGFDHGRDLAQAIASRHGLRYASLLEQPRSLDQRQLTRRERHSNMKDRFQVAEGAIVPEFVIMVDDVHTTGSTLFAAADALKAAGARKVWGLTFARV